MFNYSSRAANDNNEELESDDDGDDEDDKCESEEGDGDNEICDELLDFENNDKAEVLNSTKSNFDGIKLVDNVNPLLKHSYFKIFDEIRYVCNVDIEEHLKSMLPKLLDSILDKSHFVNDHPAVRLIKLLFKYFTNSWQQIISNKEPLSPRPAIQITTDQFIIFLDYEVISETSSIDEAICIVISLYVIFESGVSRYPYCY
ncbi:unnamed protein product [Adineta steineri]|uniref:Uncharacterized protein n=1 Tax=Adineta steineri TaxID=433720 RepID=A0A819MAB7_9BILA|nr:unnamed protein product [Adineta steineri]CAF3976451.1 unnamed protein product [Adineta steineri]